MGFVIASILMALGMAEDKAVKIGQAITLAAILAVLVAFFKFVARAFTYPLFLVAICAALTLFPDTIGWIFIQIGNIELKVMAIVMASVMPDIFNAGSGAYSSWASIWQEGLNLLPTDMVEVINGLGVAQLLGMITGTISAISVIKIYRRAMMRAGLM